jgi:hypothetical protein
MIDGTSPSGTRAFSLPVKMLLPEIAFSPSWLQAILRGPSRDMPSIIPLALKRDSGSSHPEGAYRMTDVPGGNVRTSVIALNTGLHDMHKGTREKHGSHW